MSQEKIKYIIEAALMVSVKPLNIAKILTLFETDQTLEPERDDILLAIKVLQEDYQDRGIELSEVASGYRFQAREEYAEWVNHLFDERPPRYSRASLETLAIIAYRQPITRSEIEEIRGVSVSSTIVKTLQEREWIKIVGHRDVPGKPSLLATTKTFLDYFNLKKLSDLPALEDIKDFDTINPDLFDELEGAKNTDAESDDKNTETNLDDDSEDQNVDSSSIDEPNYTEDDSNESTGEELAVVANESEELDSGDESDLEEDLNVVSIST